MGFWNAVMPYVEVLAPTIALALIFWFVMKAIFNADRHERDAEARADREFQQKLEAARASQEDSQQRD